MTTSQTRLDPITDLKAGAPFDPPVRSTGHMLRNRVASTPHRRAYSFPVADRSGDDTWKTLTWGRLELRRPRSPPA